MLHSRWQGVHAHGYFVASCLFWCSTPNAERSLQLRSVVMSWSNECVYMHVSLLPFKAKTIALKNS